MKQKSLAFRASAWTDLQSAARIYIDELGDEASVKFVDAVEKALVGIRRQPKVGSPRYAHELGIAGLRTRAIRPYPYLIFYIEGTKSIEIWRLLHFQRDIPKALAEIEPDEID